jgi:hypothetical protein
MVRRIRDNMAEQRSGAGKPHLGTVTGKDGKRYPAKKKTRTSTTTKTTKVVDIPPEEDFVEESKTPYVLKGEGLTVVHALCSWAYRIWWGWSGRAGFPPAQPHA